MNEIELLSNRINYFRKMRNMTFYQLAYRSAVPLTTLMHIMNGYTKNPGIFTIAKICNGLDITMVEFFKAGEFENFEYDVES